MAQPSFSNTVATLLQLCGKLCTALTCFHMHTLNVVQDMSVAELLTSGSYGNGRTAHSWLHTNDRLSHTMVLASGIAHTMPARQEAKDSVGCNKMLQTRLCDFVSCIASTGGLQSDRHCTTCRVASISLVLCSWQSCWHV